MDFLRKDRPPAVRSSRDSQPQRIFPRSLYKLDARPPIPSASSNLRVQTWETSSGSETSCQNRRFRCRVKKLQLDLSRRCLKCEMILSVQAYGANKHGGSHSRLSHRSTRCWNTEKGHQRDGSSHSTQLFVKRDYRTQEHEQESHSTTIQCNSPFPRIQSASKSTQILSQPHI